MSDKIVRFGILGCGAIARFHADAIAHLENAALIGVADSNITLAEKFAVFVRRAAFMQKTLWTH